MGGAENHWQPLSWRWLSEDWLRIVVASLCVLSAFLWWQGSGRKPREARQADNRPINSSRGFQLSHSSRRQWRKRKEANKARVETYVEIENEADKNLSLPLLLIACGQQRPEPIPAVPTQLVCPALPMPPAILTEQVKASIMDDLEICTENTIKAEGWAAWYREASAVPRQ